MVGYQIYPEYINSGVAWIGNVPKHWVPIRFKHRLLEKKKVSNSGLDAGSISFGRVIFKVAENLAPETKASYQEVLAGEFLINPLNMNYDLLSLRTALSAIDVVVSTGYIVIRSEDDLVKRYVRWLLQAFDVAHMKTLGSGVRQTINYLDIGNSFFYEPPKEEQQKIAQFLDHETAKIDTLIEKQQQLIRLLKEKRQAVISHAVTKGLNPSAPMRDSGVEWLGEVPEHWGVKRFKNIFKIRKRISGELGYDVLSITQKGIKVKDIESGEGQLSMDYSKYQFVDKGDFAMNHMDLLTGFVDISKYVGVTSPDYRVFTLEEKNSVPQYFLAFLQMGYINKLFFPFGQGAAHIGRWRLPTEAFNEFLAPCPPKAEQAGIAEFIIKNLEQMAALEDKAKIGIALMKERRTALISAAVTGKIDVRNWQAPATTKNKEVAT
jgi:type I restriction enzyme S subunit